MLEGNDMIHEEFLETLVLKLRGVRGLDMHPRAVLL